MSFVLSLVFGFARAHALIVGGVDVTAHDAIQRSTAALYSPSSTGPGGALCTASLIAPNMAVTAAHCVQGGSYAPVMIFGPSVNSPASVQRPVVGESVNPAYGSHGGRGMDQGDIAVVRFGGGLPAGYKPAVLDGSDDVRRGERAVLAGYGITDAHTHAGAGVLRKTEVAVANARSGKPEMILDQSHGHGACHGDSGGPAYFQRGGKIVLGGVTNRSYPASAGDDCGHKVVYTKVAAYRPWIEKSEADLNRQRGVGGLSPSVDGPYSAGQMGLGGRSSVAAGRAGALADAPAREGATRAVVSADAKRQPVRHAIAKSTNERRATASVAHRVGRKSRSRAERKRSSERKRAATRQLPRAAAEPKRALPRETQRATADRSQSLTRKTLRSKSHAAKPAAAKHPRPPKIAHEAMRSSAHPKLGSRFAKHAVTPHALKSRSSTRRRRA